MIELLMRLVIFIGDIVITLAVLGLIFFAVVAVWDMTQGVVKHYRNNRFATNLFNQIEEFRRDFS